jgi:predicted nuclease with RNAse H fold
MGSEGSIVWGPTKVPEDELAAVIRDVEPDVIAIDSPPEWAVTGKSRPIELHLARMGIHAFPTPALEHRRPLHEWMEVGFRVFEIAESCGYPLYRGDTGGFREAIEVFPHASAVVLRGGLPASGLAKQIWRRQALVDAGVDVSGLISEDALDAALAALTGLRLLQGRTCVVGQRGQAVLVLPVDRLPSGRYIRDRRATSDPPKAAVAGPPINGIRLCLCGCGAPVRRRYLPGHDAKHRSQLASATLAST